MLTGRFGDTTQRPYIEGRLILPRLQIGTDITFCVDTGADVTVLMPTDGMRLGVDYARLSGDQESVGIGGISRNFIEDAIVLFTDPGRYLYAYELNLVVCPPAPEILDVPSLLGRDILNRWRMRYDPTRDKLTFTVVSSDTRVRI